MSDHIRRLSKAQYLGTMDGKMHNITEVAEFSDDVWNCAEMLNSVPLFEDGLCKRHVEAVYVNNENTFEHILLCGEKKNYYVVIVVDLADNSIFGFYPLDLNKEYGVNG